MAVGEKTAHSEKRGHICPPSNASHPRDRWETAFVYSFITKFTTMKSKIDGFINVTDLEEALMSQRAHPVLVQILTRFILLLKPQTRNISEEQLPSTLSSFLQEHMKTTERTVFWNDELKANIEPIQAMQGSLWDASWDMKLRILRQLVEIQLVHHSTTKEMIDRAWGVSSAKHRKKEALIAPPDPTDPHSMQNLQTLPLGQDMKRVRYWAFDDSPRLYVSTNPWKTSSGFHAVSETKEDYLETIKKLKDDLPPPPPQGKPPKMVKTHKALIKTLESRIDAIDAEIARALKIRRKLEQKELYKIQAEMRTTRTRRSTRRPDYVYNLQNDSDDDGGEYKFQEDNDDEYEQMDFEDDEFGGRAVGRRRSSRASVLNANGKRLSDASDWRIERRSTRLAGADVASDYSNKRARTEERSASSAPSDTSPTGPSTASVNGMKIAGAAAIKPTEVAVEQVAGKKKSKFWYYAVEPAAGTPDERSGAPVIHPSESEPTRLNGHANGHGNGISEESTHLNGVETSISQIAIHTSPQNGD